MSNRPLNEREGVGAPDDIPLVSVVIPTRDRACDLRRCLESVEQQIYGQIETIVVDNGSSDETEQVIRSMSGMIAVWNNRNAGAAEARNQAIRRAHGNFLWFLDSDTVVDNPQCLENMIEEMKRSPDIGAIGGELVELSDGTVVMKLKFVRRNGETFTTEVPADAPGPYDCDYLATCNCLVRTELVHRIGGFDPAYFFLSEDKQLGRDIRAAGCRNVACTRTAARHSISVAGGRRSLFVKQRNVLRYALINNPPLDIVLLPFYEVYYLLCMTRLCELRSAESVVRKYVGPHVGSRSLVWKVFAVGIRYAGAILSAYLWNLVMLPRTLFVRWHRPDYLALSGEPRRTAGAKEGHGNA